MTGAYLIVSGTHASGFKVYVDTEIRAVLTSLTESVRISPIFPVLPTVSQNARKLLENNRFIVFLCPLNGYEFIGKQLEGVQERMWFSVGLPCAILFCEDEKGYQAVVGSTAALAAYEVWSVDISGNARVIKCWQRPISPPKLELRAYDDLDVDAKALLREIEVNLHEAVSGAARYMPERLLKLQRIVQAANQIIDELLFYRQPTSPAPPHLKGREAELRQDSFGRHQRINQGLTQLIQLNSSLAYAISQTTYGAVPILERPALVSHCSLLGIGTAYRALAGFTSFVERTFELHPLIVTIERIYTDPGSGVEVHPLVFRYKLSDWSGKGGGLDKHLTSSEVVPIRPKVPYFSGRLGFGEAHFSVTAAVQVLHGADSVRWSLMTLSHELLHTHVTGLLAAILGESAEIGLSDGAFRRYHAEFLAGASAAHQEKEFKPATMMESLRNMLFAFVSARGSVLEKGPESAEVPAESLDTESVTIGVPSDIDDFKKEFRSALRVLEEVVVHTLDIRYFYAGDHELFLTLLWDSWTTVPAVIGDIDSYLLRSLSSVASLQITGTSSQRFEFAYGALLSVFDKLLSMEPSNEFVRRAKNYLTQKKARLLRIFPPTLYIADMTACFFHSKKVEAALWSGDDNVVSAGDGKLAYSLETAEFTGSRVRNPVPFLADRLRIDAVNKLGLDEEYRSAWVLLATASCTPND